MFASNLLSSASLSSVDSVISEFINKNLKEFQLSKGKKMKRKRKYMENENDDEEEGGVGGGSKLFEDEVDIKLSKEELGDSSLVSSSSSSSSSPSSSHVTLTRYFSSLTYLHNAISLIPISCTISPPGSAGASSDPPWAASRSLILSQELLRRSIFSPVRVSSTAFSFGDKTNSSSATPFVSGWNSLLNHYLRFGFESPSQPSKPSTTAASKQAGAVSAGANQIAAAALAAAAAAPATTLWSAPVSQEAYAQMSVERQQQYAVWYQQFYYQQLLAQQQQQQQQQ
jgi:hypothetical protein